MLDAEEAFPHAKLAKLHCDGLGVRKSLTSVEAGLEQRASSEIVRMGLGERVNCEEMKEGQRFNFKFSSHRTVKQAHMMWKCWLRR